MIYDTSYNDQKITRAINVAVGKPFSLKERFKLKGIGSSRLVIDEVSEDIKAKLPTDESVQKASIELRPNGIIIHFKKFTEHFSWAIPYYKLVIYSSENFSIYENNSFIKFSKKTLRKPQLKFIKKLLYQKAVATNNSIPL